MAAMRKTKACTRCRKIFPATTEYFYKNGHYLTSRCKSCIDKIHALWVEAHRAQVAANQRRWVKKNPEQARESTDKWWHGHPEQARERNRRMKQRHEARRRLLITDFTVKQWRRALIEFHYCCAVCGRPRGLWHALAQDHWIPESKGGHYTATNIVPLCHGIDGCNNKKGKKDAHEWLVQEHGKRKAAKIEARIQAYFDWVRAQDGADGLAAD
jgi:hypothetical protein